MAAHVSRLRRPSLSLLHPQSWWDYLFICLAAGVERLMTISAARWLSAGPIALFRLLIWGVSPAAELNFDHRPNWTRIIVVATGAALATLIFSFGLNYLFSTAAQTLSGADPRRLYYLDDVHNIVIYTVVAPIYIACASVIIYVFLSGSLSMRRFDELLSPREMLLLTFQFIAFALFVLGLDAWLQFRYHNEIITNYSALPHMQTKRYEHCRDLIYWFAELGPTNSRTLNIAGMFYFIGNFVRLGTILVAVFCFLGASVSVIRLGVSITAHGGVAHDVTGIRQRLYVFSVIELWVKALYFILSIHSKVWAKSCLIGGSNIVLAGTAVFIVGWILITVPRNFAEYRLWRHLRERAESDPREGMPDLRSDENRWLYVVSSSLFFLAVGSMFLLSGDGPVGPKSVIGILQALGLGWLALLLGLHL